MKKTPLKRNTPLKAKTTLKTKTPLKAKTSLKVKTTLKVKTGLKNNPNKKPLTNKTKIYKPKYKYESIFTDDLNKCFITKDTKDKSSIHIHHIFGASNKVNSEKYHFLIPLRADWHDMADYGVHFNKEFDLKLKRLCEEYWLDNYGTKEDFIKVFGKWY